MWRSDPRVFDTAHERAKGLLMAGKNVMIDSVYMDEQTRKYAIDALKDVADVHMIVMDTPVEICKERNARREQPVEDWVYDTLSRSFAEPSLDEGLKSIHHFDRYNVLVKNSIVANDLSYLKEGFAVKCDNCGEKFDFGKDMKGVVHGKVFQGRRSLVALCDDCLKASKENPSIMAFVKKKMG